MTKEYQEQMTEYMKSQKVNPIVSVYVSHPVAPRMKTSVLHR